jgi:putative ABC transport system permease protein
MLSHLRQDLQYAARTLSRSPGFSLLTILIWAVGVGTTIAMFSIVYATLIKPLPFREPEKLMSVFLRMPAQAGVGEIDMVWSYPKYQAFTSEQTAFEQHALHMNESFIVRRQDATEAISGESISAAYFGILGIRPQLGRDFLETEDRATGGERFVMISDSFWREWFAASNNAIGQGLIIGNVNYTVIGVLPPGFRGLTGNARIWTLYTANRSVEALRSAGAHQFEVVARLAPGQSAMSAKQNVRKLASVIDAAFPPGAGRPWGAAAYTLDELRIDPTVGRSVLVLALAGALLMFIASINVVGLQLARTASKQSELSVRVAIGATSGRLVRQLLTESLSLAAVGSALGLLMATIAVRTLAMAAPASASTLSTVRGTMTSLSLGSISVDAKATVAAIVAALATAIVVGLVPAWSAARKSVADSLRVGTVSRPTFGGIKRLNGRGALVVAEVALAVVLLVTSGLMVRSLSLLFDAQVGYRPDNLLTARIALSPAAGDTRAVADRWNEILAKVSSIPGIVSAAVGSCAPVGDHCEGTEIQLQGQNEPARVAFHSVSPGYFATLGVRMDRGRDITATDVAGSTRVMVINQAAARMIWRDNDPLRLPAVLGNGPVEVVGVAGDVRYEDIEAAPKPAIFFPNAQQTRRSSTLFVRTTGEPTSVAAAVRREVRALDVAYAVTDVRTMQARMIGATARNRFATQVLVVFATMALALASLGIYGVLALTVAERRRELGIRMALGANQTRVLRMILGQALTLAGVGALAGSIGAIAAARAIGTLLYGVPAADPTTYGWSALVLSLAVLAAAAVPAVRAMRVNPMVAIRAG